MVAWFLRKQTMQPRFGFHSTAEEVTQGIDGSGLTAIVTGEFPQALVSSILFAVFFFFFLIVLISNDLVINVLCILKQMSIKKPFS